MNVQEVEERKTGYVMGYGGYCLMTTRRGEKPYSTVALPMTGGSYSRTVSNATARSFSFETEGGMIRTGDRVLSFGGSFSFDATAAVMQALFARDSPFFTRECVLDFVACDGNDSVSIPDCVWSGFSLAASPNGLVQSSVQFNSTNGRKRLIDVSKAKYGTKGYEHSLEPYWSYGEEGVVGFDIQFSRGVTPMYLNEPLWSGPSYFLVGYLDASLNVECFAFRKWDGSKRRIAIGKTEKGMRHVVFGKSWIETESGLNFTDISGMSSSKYGYSAQTFDEEPLFTITEQSME